MVAISFDKGLPVVGAANNLTAVAGATVTNKIVHAFVIKRGVVDRNFFPGGNVSARNQIQTFQPGIWITRVVDRFPMFRIGTPTDKNLISQRVGILRKPNLLLRIPVFPDMLLA